MSKRFFIGSVIFLVFYAAVASAEEAGAKAHVRGPITVTSETLTSDSKSHTALFEKDVVAKTTDTTIYSDKMLVYYKETGGEVTKIEASGNVRLLKNNRLITSAFATYYADEEKVVFTGEPRATDGDNVVTGTKMTYYLNDDHSEVEKSKVFMKNTRGK